MRLIVFAGIALAFFFTAVGCSPTRTAGTEGLAKDQLAILHMTEQYDVPVVKVTAIRFDDGEKYAIGGSRDFFLTPGVHHVTLDLTTKIDSPFSQYFPMGDAKLESPPGLTTGDLKAGRTYEIPGLAGIVQGMANTGDMAITREMATK